MPGLNLRTKLIGLGVIVAVLLAAPFVEAAGKRYAVVVGVKSHRSSQPLPEWLRLVSYCQAAT